LLPGVAKRYVEQGKTPLEALRLAGYANPERELRRQIAVLAPAAHPTNELQVLVDIAQLGRTEAALSACAALIQHAPPEELRFECVYSIVDTSLFPLLRLPEGVRVWKLPDEMAQAIAELDRLHAAPILPPDDGSPLAVARRVLRAIIARKSEKEVHHVRAAKMLLSEHLQSVEQHTELRYIFFIPPNGRLPITARTIDRTLFVDGSDIYGDATSLLQCEYAERRLDSQLHDATDYEQFRRPNALPAQPSRLLAREADLSPASVVGGE
jgi:hypothetical protein